MCRLSVLPLVNKRWACILRRPSEAWQHADIDLASLLLLRREDSDDDDSNDLKEDEAALAALDERAAAAWFGRRPNCVQRMMLRTARECEVMPAVTTAMIMGSQCSSLRELCVEVNGVGLDGVEVAALAALTRLHKLEVIADDLLKDRGETLLWTVACLPALLELIVSYNNRGVLQWGSTGGVEHGLPRCYELAQLRSNSLTRLRVSMLGGPPQHNTLRLIGLPRLESCVINAASGAYGCTANIRIDADSLKGVQHLRELRINGDAGLKLQPHCFTGLTALTSLSLGGLRRNAWADHITKCPVIY